MDWNGTSKALGGLFKRGDTVLTIEEIKRFLDDAESDKQSIQAKVGRRYYDANHDICKYRLFYYDANGKLQEDTTRSNIKISHPFFAELVDQEVQYLLSNKDRIIVAEDAELQKEMDAYFNDNDSFRAELAETCTDAVVCGWGWMYAYMGRDERLSFQRADPLHVKPVEARFASDGKDYMLYRYTQRADNSGRLIHKIIVMDDTQQWMFEQIGNGAIELDREAKINPCPHIVYQKDNSDDSYWEGLGFLPWFRLDNNRKRQSGLHPIKALIDDYDLMACGLSNNLQDLTEGIYVVKGYDGDDISEIVTNLRVKKAIGTSDTGGVDVKTIDIPYAARKVKLDLDKESIYHFGMGFDPTQVGDGNVTNVVIKSRYALLDIKCNKAETNLRNMMGGIIDVVLELINQERGTAYKRADIQMDFRRECITNESDNAGIEQAKATAAQTRVNTLMSAAAQIGVDAVLDTLCKELDLDAEDVRKKMEQAKAETADGIISQLQEVNADDKPAEAVSTV